MSYRLHADIVSFSEEFYRKYPKEWQKNENHWDELFSEMEVNVNVEAHIRRQGNINKPGVLPYEVVKEK